MNPGESGQARKTAWPAMLNRIAVILAAWPWWAVITLVGLVIAIYSLLTVPIYHRALTFVNGNPQLNTNRIANVSYVVRQPDGNSATVSGTLTNETNDTLTIITQDEVQISLTNDEVADMTCNGAASTNNCPINSSVSLTRKTASGALTFEDLGKYQIDTIFGQENILKIDLATAPLDGTLIAIDQLTLTMRTTDGAQLVLT